MSPATEELPWFPAKDGRRGTGGVTTKVRSILSARLKVQFVVARLADTKSAASVIIGPVNGG